MSAALFSVSRLGWFTLASVVALVGVAVVSGIILVAVSVDVPAGWVARDGGKADLLGEGYGPYFSGSTERDAPSIVSVLIPRQEFGGNAIFGTVQHIA